MYCCCLGLLALLCLLHRAIDASYVDPDTMDFEGQEWVLPDEPRAKPEKVIDGVCSTAQRLCTVKVLNMPVGACAAVLSCSPTKSNVAMCPVYCFCFARLPVDGPSGAPASIHSYMPHPALLPVLTNACSPSVSLAPKSRAWSALPLSPSSSSSSMLMTTTLRPWTWPWRMMQQMRTLTSTWR